MSIQVSSVTFRCRALLALAERRQPGGHNARARRARPQLLTRFGSDGWELAALQEHREGGMGTGYWDAVCSLTTYTFKRLEREAGHE